MYGNVRGYMKKTIKKTTKTAKTKRIVKTEPQNEEIIFPEESSFAEQTEVQPEINPKKRQFPSLTTITIFLLLGILLGILIAYQGMPIAAIVNGQPIFRWEVANMLFQRYGQQSLQGIITERLIAAEAQKSGVSVTQSDIDEKAKQILSSFGSSMSVDDFLKFQGMEKKDFDNQIKLQLTVEKLLGKDLNITEQDVTNYIASNQAILVATDPAKLREEAANALRDEQIGEKVQTWLQEIKAKASIKSFL